jgi:D-alanyl-D-alanine carboxypeptidase/D-alanyl-D-alanine-endopeptidase (penicillin-binding protein 4)
MRRIQIKLQGSARLALVLPLVAALAAVAGIGAGSARAASPTVVVGNVRASVAAAIAQIESKPAYDHSIWGIRVADLSTGEVLINQTGETMFVPGSIMKVYSTPTALDIYGPDYRFHTPVYRLGKVSNGVLEGNLALVASGDFSFGLREQPDGTLAFNSLPDLDHNYADTGFPGGAVVKGSNPLAALDELAGKVPAAGIRKVQGNVVIDDRLFTTFREWPDGLISPIWVNENVIDITTTPTTPGKPATVDWRPKTAALKVVSDVLTLASGAERLHVDSPRSGLVRISGQITADSPPTLNIWQILNPAAFARTAFIEALERAGVNVTAPATGANPEKLLPKSRTYPANEQVAEHISPPLSEFVKVILKVSYNRAADLMLCLAATKVGSSDCTAGIGRELQLLTRLGVSTDSTIVFDGAGSDDRGRTSPADATTFLRNITGETWGAFIRNGMSILGVDGTQATNGVGTPAAGHIQVKDGSRAATAPGDYQGILMAKTQVGYIDAKSGRQLIYAVFLNDSPFLSVDDYSAADHDVAAIAAAIQQGY